MNMLHKEHPRQLLPGAVVSRGLRPASKCYFTYAGARGLVHAEAVTSYSFRVRFHVKGFEFQSTWH